MGPYWRTRAVTGVTLFLEGCALYLVFSVVAHLTKVEQLPMPFWLVIASLAWGFALSSWILGMKVTPVLRGVTGLALGVPSLMVLTAWNAGLALHPFDLLLSGGMGGIGLFVGTVIFLLITWWRGVELSREDVTLDAVRSAFQIGMIVLLAAALVDAAVEGRIVSGFFVVGFFAVGLMGMALARFSSETGEDREMPKQWIWPIAACVAAVLVLGLVISGLGVGGLDDVTRAVVNLVGSLGYRLLEPVLLVIGFLAGALVSVGNWLSSVLGGGSLEGLMDAQRRLDEFHESLREAESGGDGSALFTALKWAAAVIGAAFATVVIYSLFKSRRRRGHAPEVIESRESLFSLKRAGDDINEALSGLFGGLFGSSRRRTRRFRSPRDYYHALLELSERAGRPREEWETPREHQRGLAGVLPADPVARIVDEFQAAHYGGSAADAELLGRLESDRLALEEFLRRLPREGRAEG